MKNVVSNSGLGETITVEEVINGISELSNGKWRWYIKWNVKISSWSDYFKCTTIGIRQGCILSPFLFAFYIGELVDMMEDKGCKGIYINEEVPDLVIILYADDTAEGSDTVGRLQFMINVLVEYCRLWSLIVNLCKTKIAVFRRNVNLNVVKNGILMVGKWMLSVLTNI